MVWDESTFSGGSVQTYSLAISSKIMGMFHPTLGILEFHSCDALEASQIIGANMNEDSRPVVRIVPVDNLFQWTMQKLSSSFGSPASQRAFENWEDKACGHFGSKMSAFLLFGRI